MPMSSLRFVIIEENDFIASDMEAGLRSACPGSIVARVFQSEDVGRLPDDADRRTIYITGDRLDVIDASGLAELAARQGAHIVVRAGWDSDAAVAARGFDLLEMPFTDDRLAIVTRKLLPDRAA